MVEQFELRSEHVEMLQEASWREAPAGEGTPMIDGKRPFGFSGDVVESAAAELDGYDASSLTGYEYELLEQCFEELPTAIRVVLSAESFEPRTYKKTSDSSWEPVE